MTHFSKTYVALLLSLWALLLPLKAQASGRLDTLALLQTYPSLSNNWQQIVHLDQAQLHLPADSAHFLRFRHLLSCLQQGQPQDIHIMHIGGSHVQAGHFSHRLRQRFRALAPECEASRGLLFPWRSARTNGPSSYSVTSTGVWQRSRCVEAHPSEALGISGMAVTTADTAATLHLTMTDSTYHWGFRRLTLLGHASSAEVEPLLVTAQGDTLHATAAPEHYTFALADTATSCRILFSGLEQGSFTVRGLFAHTDRPGITYTACGVNGASLPSWLRCSLFQQDAKALCVPDLLILGVGINDANVPLGKFDASQFMENYRQLIQRIRTLNPEVAIVFVVNNDCWLRIGRRRYGFNRNTKTVEQCMTALAKEMNAAVFSQYAIMGGYGSSDRWVRAGLMNRDHIHFLAPGYRLMADLLFDAILSVGSNENPQTPE